MRTELLSPTAELRHAALGHRGASFTPLTMLKSVAGEASTRFHRVPPESGVARRSACGATHSMRVRVQGVASRLGGIDEGGVRSTGPSHRSVKPCCAVRRLAYPRSTGRAVWTWGTKIGSR